MTNASFFCFAEFQHKLTILIASCDSQPSTARKRALKGADVHGMALGIMY